MTRRISCTVLFAVFLGVLAETALMGAVGSRPPDRQRGSEVVNAHRQSLVIIEGERGSGSGFILEIQKRKYLVSNTHVLAGMRNPKFKLLDGGALKLGRARIAMGHDIIIFEVVEGGQALKMATAEDPEFKMGARIVVPGNAGGRDVVNALQGEIIGIGSDRIEITAPIIPGSSGSPIIQVENGSVAGIATYSIEMASGRDDGRSRLLRSSTRRLFGYRLDSVKGWQNIEWTRFQDEADRLTRMEKETEDIMVASLQVVGRDASRSMTIGTLAIREMMADFHAKLKENPDSAEQLRKTCLSTLLSINETQVSTARAAFTYDYFKKAFEEQARNKAVITAELKRLVLE